MIAQSASADDPSAIFNALRTEGRPKAPLVLSDTGDRCRSIIGHWEQIVAERSLSITTNAYPTLSDHSRTING